MIARRSAMVAMWTKMIQVDGGVDVVRRGRRQTVDVNHRLRPASPFCARVILAISAAAGSICSVARRGTNISRH